MIITRDKIYNKSEIKITTNNASIFDSGFEGNNTRNEVIYIDFEVTELPTSLSIKLLNALTSTVLLTTDEQEYGTIDFRQAITQANPPENWGDITEISSVISDCQNSYSDLWSLASVGLAIVPTLIGYHIYCAALNAVHKSHINWRFGEAFIIYQGDPNTITMLDEVGLQNGIQIDGAIKIDSNGLCALPRSEGNIYQFQGGTTYSKVAHRRSVYGVRHDDSKGDSFTFTNDLTALEKSLDYDTGCNINYEEKWGDNIHLSGGVTTEPNTIADHDLCYHHPYYNADYTTTFTTDSDNFITKIQLKNYNGNSFAETGWVSYSFHSIDFIEIKMPSTGTVILKDGSVEEEGLPSVEKTIIDTNQEPWTAVYNTKGIMRITPKNNLNLKYKPIFLASYAVGNVLINTIPLNSVPYITSSYYTGDLPANCIVIGKTGELIFYREGTSVTNAEVIAFIRKEHQL